MGLCLWSISFLAQFFVSPAKVFNPIPDQQWQSLNSKPERLAKGEMEYKLRCYKCHGYSGEGNDKGPSLIESSWVQQSSYNDVYRVIFEGRPDIEKYGYGKKLLIDDLQSITLHVKKINLDYHQKQP